MKNSIVRVELNRLLPHPGNPNRMSKANFARLVRHIDRSDRYEPLIVRPHPSCVVRDASRETATQNAVCRMQYQIINGHHRFEALKQLGYKTCDCVVWDIDDDEANLLLATLNRLCGQDVLEAKCALLEKLNTRLKVDELAKLLPQTKTQIRRLIDLHRDKLKIQLAEPSQHSFPHPLVFFLSTEQKQIVDKALSVVAFDAGSMSKAQRNAQALAHIAATFISEVTDGDENQIRATGAR